MAKAVKRKAPAKKAVAKKTTTKKPAPKKQAKPGKKYQVTTDAAGNVKSIKEL